MLYKGCENVKIPPSIWGHMESLHCTQKRDCKGRSRAKMSSQRKKPAAGAEIFEVFLKDFPRAPPLLYQKFGLWGESIDIL